MFLTKYSVLGSDLHGIITPCRSLIKIESDVYPLLKRASERRGWLYSRIETRDKRGMPDILVVRGPEYWFIEVKRLKKKKLVTIEDDLEWQFGQLAFMKDCLRTRSRYMLAVAKENTILFLKGAYANEHLDYPDFAEQF